MTDDPFSDCLLLADDFTGTRAPHPARPIRWSGFLRGAPHADDSYMRLAQTVDLTAVPAADTPHLGFAISYDTESEGFDSGPGVWSIPGHPRGAHRTPAVSRSARPPSEPPSPRGTP